MPRLKRVLSLENLALDAVAASVIRAATRIVDSKLGNQDQANSCIGKRLVRLKKLRLKWMKQHSCFRWLNHFLYCSLSADLSEKLSARAIKAIDRLSMDYMCTGSDLASSSERFQTAQMLKNLTLAVLCPHVTVLNLTELHYLVPQVLWDNPPRRLQVLLMGRSLRESTILSGLPQLRNLVSFTMWENCTDRIVTALGEACTQLERLDVSMSMLYVSDASARAVVKLSPRLKELKLCGTGLTQCGFSRILTGLPSRTKPSVLETKKQRDTWSHGLVTLEAQRLSTYHFVLLVQMYPNLVSLRILHVYGDLSVLASLTSLRELEVRHGKLDSSLSDVLTNLSTFLEQKGSDLTSLVVQTVDFAEVQIICRHCVTLRSLGLYVRQSSSIQLCCQRVSILPRCKPKRIQPLLPKLETLVMYNEDDLNNEKASHLVEYLLSAGCANVKTVELYDYGNIDDAFLCRVLEKHRMQHLEKFVVGNHLYYYPFGESIINLSMKTIRLLLEHCANMEEVGYLKEWQHISEQDLMVLKEELKLSNINLTLKLRNNSRYARGTLLRIRSSKEM